MMILIKMMKTRNGHNLANLNLHYPDLANFVGTTSICCMGIYLNDAYRMMTMLIIMIITKIAIIPAI